MYTKPLSVPNDVFFQAIQEASKYVKDVMGLPMLSIQLPAASYNLPGTAAAVTSSS
jgi:hypothetical protein